MAGFTVPDGEIRERVQDMLPVSLVQNWIIRVGDIVQIEGLERVYRVDVAIDRT